VQSFGFALHIVPSYQLVVRTLALHTPSVTPAASTVLWRIRLQQWLRLAVCSFLAVVCGIGRQKLKECVRSVYVLLSILC
jgi:hypothetical protein